MNNLCTKCIDLDEHEVCDGLTTKTLLIDLTESECEGGESSGRTQVEIPVGLTDKERHKFYQGLMMAINIYTTDYWETDNN